ncbi:MAG: polymer-forming cytoskeletal protein [Dysgonomonas sp.]|nr:polymer-forming cytoskeletal protein [Dysgonomonas sp.]
MARNRETIITSSTHNILASGTQMKGNISAEEDFRIDGILEGNINCKGKIIIGTNGEINGEIECINVDLLGKVKGNILCHETVILRSSCTMTGEVKTQTIEIEPGATFTGSCSMKE